MKKRQSNFELLRITSMFLIVFWHLINHGHLLEKTTGNVNMVLTILYCLGMIHVNSFVLVCGYFQYDKKFSIKKFLTIFNAQWFYRVVLTLLIVGLGLIKLSNIELIKNLGPLDFGNYWFVNYYLALYLLSPFLNKLIANLSQKEHKNLLYLGFVLFSIIPMVTNHATLSNGGFNIVQFVFLYIIGAYFHKYPIAQNIHFKGCSRKKRQIFFFSMMIFLAALNFILGIAMTSLQQIGGSIITYITNNFLSNQFSYDNPLVMIQSICYLLYFETLVIDSKWINKFSKLVFGIYLIHDLPLVQMKLFDWLEKVSIPIRNSLSYIPFLFLLAIVIFMGCAMIEKLRQLLFKFVSKRKRLDGIRNRFWHYFESV